MDETRQKRIRRLSEVTRERNREIVNTCIAIARKYISEGVTKYVDDIVAEVAMLPASKFYVTEERARNVIRAWLNHESKGNPYPSYADPEKMTILRRKMFMEIYSRYKILSLRMPSKSMSYIIRKVINSPAPSFYITRKSLRVYFYTSQKRKPSRS